MLNKIINCYLFLPFAVVLFITAGFFIKKISVIDIISKIYAIVNFAFCFLFLTKVNFHNFEFFNINFEFNSISCVFLFASGLIFLLFIFISKDTVLKLNKLLYAALILLSGITNLFILSDSVFLNLALVFWFLLVCFALFYSFVKKSKEKKNLNICLINDLIFYFLAVFLIFFNFVDFFAVNNIALSFSNIKQNIYFINSTSLQAAFIGFLIIVFRLFNFVFVSYRQIRTVKYINNFISSFVLILSLFMGNVLLVKLIPGFYEIFYQYRDIICACFIFNFIYYIILSIKENNLIRFFGYNLCSFVNISLIALLTFSKNSLNIALSYFFALILSFVFAFFVSIVLENKMKVGNIDEFKKLKKEDKKIKLLILFSFLNVSNIPLLALFAPLLTCLVLIFSTEFDLGILKYSICILIMGCIILGCNILNILNKILIQPVGFVENKIKISKIQTFVFLILVLMVVLFGFMPNTL